MSAVASRLRDIRQEWIAQGLEKPLELEIDKAFGHARYLRIKFCNRFYGQFQTACAEAYAEIEDARRAALDAKVLPSVESTREKVRRRRTKSKSDKK